jgi:hypothetical protein
LFERSPYAGANAAQSRNYFEQATVTDYRVPNICINTYLISEYPIVMTLEDEIKNTTM